MNIYPDTSSVCESSPENSEEIICQHSETFSTGRQEYILSFPKTMAWKEFKKRSEQFKVEPMAVYPIRGNTPYKEGFWAVFVCDQIIPDGSHKEIVTKILKYIFPEADQKYLRSGCKSKELIKNESARINIRDLAISLSSYIRQIDSHNFSRRMRTIAGKLGVTWNGKELEIYSAINEENVEKTSNTLLVEEETSSKDANGVLDPRREGKAGKIKRKYIKGISDDQLKKCCPLFREFLNSEKRLRDEQIELILSNLLFIEGGYTIFRQNTIKNKEFWKKKWDYGRKTYKEPICCNEQVCPYALQCKCNTIIERVKAPVLRIKEDEESFISKEAAQGRLRIELSKAVQSSDDSIHLIIAQTALGKTTAYCELVKKRYEAGEKNVMIVVPTTKLQEQVERKLKALSVPCFKTPNLDKLLTENGLTELKDIVDTLYQKGFSCKVRKTVVDYCKKNRDQLNEKQIEALKSYLSYRKSLNGKCCVITTHALFLYMSEDILCKYELIVDEDILMTIFKRVGQINFKDIRTAMKNKMFSTENSDRMNKLLYSPHDTVDFTATQKLISQKEINELYKKRDLVASSVMGLINSDTVYVNQTEKCIHYFHAIPLPNIKMVIVSATAEPDLYKEYCNGRSVIVTRIECVKYTGKLIQYVNDSMSRSFIQKTVFEKMVAKIKRTLGTKLRSDNLITFLRFDPKSEIHFGKCEGYNDFEGRDLCVIGTPHLNPFIYQLIGRYLGYESEKSMAKRKVIHKNLEFSIMTYRGEHLRKLQFYFIESELEQAVGRARLLHHPCFVHLFSNFPLHQAEIDSQTFHFKAV